MKEVISGRVKAMYEGVEAEKAWHIQGTQVLLGNKGGERGWEGGECQQMELDRYEFTKLSGRQQGAPKDNLTKECHETFVSEQGFWLQSSGCVGGV